MLRFLILALALTAGGGAAWMAYMETSRGPEDLPQVRDAPIPEPVESHKILVASADITVGTELTRGDLEWRVWPEAGLADIYVRQEMRPDAMSDLVGRRARGRFIAGEPILEAKLIYGTSGFLASLLEPGERAVAVRITAQNTAGGFILPGDRVDVFYTREGDGDLSTRTILESVEVLAIDQMTSETDGTVDSALGSTATLRVDASQARILTSSETTGRLSLALRASEDYGVPTSVLETVTPQPRQSSIRVRRAGAEETVTLQ